MACGARSRFHSLIDVLRLHVSVGLQHDHEHKAHYGEISEGCFLPILRL
jgi:hypothetical protein